MGERANEIDPYQNEGYGSSNSDQYAIVSEQGTATSSDDDQATEAIRSDIEQTRSEMGQTINAIQEKLNPQQLMEQAKNTAVEAATEVMDHAKEAVTETVDHVRDSAKDVAVDTVDHAKQTVRDATVGKVEHMVSNMSETAQETGSGIMGTIKSNPIPAALVGLGLGWLFFQGQGKSSGRSTPSPVGMDYATAASYRYPVSPYSTPTQASGSDGITSRLMSTVRQNPIPAAAAGLGLGYLVMQGQTANKQSDGNSINGQSGQSQGMGSKVSSVAGGVGDKVGGLAHQAGDTLGDIGQKAGNITGKAGELVGDVAGGVGGKVSDLAGGIGDTFGGMTEGMQHQTERAKSQFGQMLEDRPLMVGIIALSVGAAVGMMLPNTPQENQIMGDVRNSFMEKAQETVQQTVEKVQRVTEEVGTNAKSAMEDLGNTAKVEAQKQGLT